MQNKKRKTSVGFALLVVAMISLVGVGFALNYSGSAVTTIPDESSEYITMNVAKSNTFNTGVYTVDSLNEGSYVTVSNLELGETSATMYTAGHFTYADGFTWVTGAPAGSPASGVYYASVVGSYTLTIRQPATATATDVDLSISNILAPVVNQYGLSLVYTKQVNGGTEVVFTPAGGIADISFGDAVDGVKSATVVVTVYVVYSTYVPVGNIASIRAFSLTGVNDVMFTATAQTVAP